MPSDAPGSAPRDGMGPPAACARALRSLEIAWRAAPWSLVLYSVLTVAAGDNVLRILPPLNIEDAHIAEFVEGLSSAARAYDSVAAAA